MFKRHQEPSSGKLQKPQQFGHPVSSGAATGTSHISCVLLASQIASKRAAQLFCQSKMYIFCSINSSILHSKVIVKINIHVQNIFLFPVFGWQWGFFFHINLTKSQPYGKGLQCVVNMRFKSRLNQCSCSSQSHRVLQTPIYCNIGNKLLCSKLWRLFFHVATLIWIHFLSAMNSGEKCETKQKEEGKTFSVTE